MAHTLRSLSADKIVRGDLLLDLISAVREMQSGGKPIESLDAYKQLGLME